MRLVTWNACKGRFATKVPHLDHYFADVAVVQEIAKPLAPRPDVLWFGVNPNQGIAVIVREPYTISPLPQIDGAPSYVIPVLVSGPDTFVLFAVWTLGYKPYPYVCAASRAIDLYVNTFREGQVVMMGDFNSNAIWNKEHPEELNHSAMLARLENHGLLSAYHAFSGEPHGAETMHTFYFQWNRQKSFHIDFCFVPKSWAPKVSHVDVGSFSAWRRWSDHRPLFVEIADPSDRPCRV